MKTYADKLRDPRWQRKRLEIMQRDDFKCRRCGDGKETLNVHHRIYTGKSNPWEYGNEWFLTLCEPCHEKAEQMRNRICKYLGEVPSAEYLAEWVAFAEASKLPEYSGWANAVACIVNCMTRIKDGDEGEIPAIRSLSEKAIESIRQSVAEWLGAFDGDNFDDRK